MVKQLKREPQALRADFGNRLSFVVSIVVISLASAGCTTNVNVKSGSQTGDGDRQGTSPAITESSTEFSSGSFAFPLHPTTAAESIQIQGGNSIVNGRYTGTDGKEVRYSTRSVNGVEAKLEAPGGVIFLKGKLAKCPADAVISLCEKRNGTMQVGELRPDGAHVRIWMKRGDSFQLGTAEEQAWADNLLSTFKLDDTPEPEKVRQADKYKLGDPQLAKQLATLRYSKDVTELVCKKASVASLSATEQVALIDLVFDKIHYQKDRKAILLDLIHRKDLTKKACTHLLDNLEKVHYESDRKLIQRELFKRSSSAM